MLSVLWSQYTEESLYTFLLGYQIVSCDEIAGFTIRPYITEPSIYEFIELAWLDLTTLTVNKFGDIIANSRGRFRVIELKFTNEFIFKEKVKKYPSNITIGDEWKSYRLSRF